MKIKRIICISLLIVMLLTTFAGCTDTGTKETNDTQDSVGSDTITEETFDVPEDLRYDGYEFVVLVSGNYANNDFEVEENSSDVVNAAKYKKNLTVEQRLGITISNVDKVAFGSTRGAGPGFTLFQQSYVSNSFDYDMGVIGAYDCGTLAYSGYLTDLNTLPNMNLERSWWDQNANEDLAILNKLFFTAGDISLTYKKVTHCILFNKELIVQYPMLQNPYELVENDNWTFDTFAEEVKKISEDLNANQTADKEDRFGLMSWNDPHLAVITASGEKILTVKDDGTLSLTLYTDRSEEALRKYCEMLFDSEHAFNYQYNAPSSEWNTTRDAVFNENRALYYMTTFVTVARHRNMDTDFGILPYPKLDAEQEEYYHTDTPFSTSFVCVPFLTEDEDRTGAIMETLAYYSKQYLTPAYYEQTLVGTYIRDDESEEMLDLIFATRCYDLGSYYDVGAIGSKLTAMLNTRTFTFASLCAGISDTAKAQVEDINTKYSGINN